jgi:hypothetical protein
MLKTKERFVVLGIVVLISVFAVSAASWGTGGGGGGGGEGGGGTSAFEKSEKETQRLVQIFVSQGHLTGKDLNDGEALISKRVTDSCTAAYMVAASYLRAGEYEKGKDLMMQVLESNCYDSLVNLWGDDEMLRTLAASELALHAGAKGDYEVIERVEKRLQPDAVTDRLLVRDAAGILQGKTKLRDIVRFHKARAYKNAEMADKASEVLKELTFASGKVFVDGEVQGLSDAIKELQNEIQAVAALILKFFALA